MKNHGMLVMECGQLIEEARRERMTRDMFTPKLAEIMKQEIECAYCNKVVTATRAYKAGNRWWEFSLHCPECDSYWGGVSSEPK